MGIQDRVVEFKRIAADELRGNPRNWRKHPQQQQKALRKVLEKIGFAGAALAYTDPEWGLTLIDGHLRKDQMGAMPIPVLITDLTREEANALLAVHDPLAAMAGQDDELLKGLIAELPAFDLGDVGGEVAALAGLTMETEGGTWEQAFDGIPTEDRALFQQMTFTLHDTQVDIVKRAISAAHGMGDYDTPNENGNGNALARICEAYLNGQG